MFGLPTHRTRTPVKADGPICPDDGTDPNIAYGCCPTCPRVIKSALRLAEMKWNHYTMLISQDWKNLRSWGARTTAGNTGPGSNTNEPYTVPINWVGGVKEEIIYLRSVGYDMYSLFRTSDNNVYATGSTTSIFNGVNPGDNWERILTNVVDIYVGGGQSTASSIYVKTNGKVYGLGAARTSGFGSITTALTQEGLTELNYLGIDNATKAWLQYFGDQVNTTKSFVLKTDGTLWACGYNADGGLGVNSSNTHVMTWSQVVDSTGTPLQNVADVITTTSSPNASYFLTKDGFVYTCGANTNGELGLGLSTATTRLYASKIESISRADLISSTDKNHAVIVTTKNNEVYTWGTNNNGQCGVGNFADVTTATKIDFPSDKRVTFVHGGGMYGEIDPAFCAVREDGTVYVCGNNQTYALGVPNFDGQNIPVFTRNDYFGFDSPKLIEPWRFPLTIINGGSYAAGSTVIENAALYLDKSVTPPGIATRTERVYVNPGYYVTGPGIPYGTYVTYVSGVSGNMIGLSERTLTAQTSATITYINYPKAYQADLCGYPNEMAMKVVSEDGTLYQCGWNQVVPPLADPGPHYWNFNPRIGTQTVNIPTAFEADF
jgi:alpha-tubulin suppressor-like RCC1 family protein